MVLCILTTSQQQCSDLDDDVWEGKKKKQTTKQIGIIHVYLEITPQYAKNVNRRCLAEGCYLPV